MCQKSDKDEDSDFQKDFELVRNTLQEIGFLKKDKVFKSCVELLQRRGYTYLFTYDLLLQDYVENISS